MPLYEYACPSCGQGFERLVRGFSDAGEVTCPVCGGTHAKRKISMMADTSRGRSSAGSFSAGAACSPGGT